MITFLINIIQASKNKTELRAEPEKKWIMNTKCKFNPELADLTIKIANQAQKNNCDMAFFELNKQYYVFAIEGKNVYLLEENDCDDPTKLKEYKDILKNNNSNVLIYQEKQKFMVFNFKLPVEEQSKTTLISELDGDAFST